MEEGIVVARHRLLLVFGRLEWRVQELRSIRMWMLELRRIFIGVVRRC